MKSKFIINCTICSKPVDEYRNYHLECLSNKDKLKFKPKIERISEKKPQKKIQIEKDIYLIKTSYDLKETTIYI